MVILGLLTLQVLTPRQFALISRSVNMEWGFKENRVAVIARHKCGKSGSQIFELLKPLKISRKYACRAIRRYKELWGVEERARSGRPRCVRNKAAFKTVLERIRRNPLRKQNSLSRELNISPRSTSRLSRDDPHARAYRRSKGVRDRIPLLLFSFAESALGIIWKG